MAGGLHNHRSYQAAVVFSVLHALLFLGLTRFRVAAFPNQFRLTYLLMIVVLANTPARFRVRLPEGAPYRSAAIPDLELDIEAFWRALPS